MTAEEGQSFFEVDCGCSAEEQSCQHVVDIHIKNNLEEKYDVNKPVTVHCDHCNLPSLELILKMEPAAGGESYPVPHLVGRDENVLIFFEKGQSCNRIQRCVHVIIETIVDKTWKKRSPRLQKSEVANNSVIKSQYIDFL